MAILFTLRVFITNLLRERCRRNIFSYFRFGLGFELGPYFLISQHTTYCTMDYKIIYRVIFVLLNIYCFIFVSIFIIVYLQDIVQISSDDCKWPAINACCAAKMIKGSQLLILVKLPQSLWNNRKKRHTRKHFYTCFKCFKRIITFRIKKHFFYFIKKHAAVVKLNNKNMAKVFTKNLPKQSERLMEMEEIEV